MRYPPNAPVARRKASVRTTQFRTAQFRTRRFGTRVKPNATRDSRECGRFFGENLPRSPACRQQDFRTAGQQSSRPAILRSQGARPFVLRSFRPVVVRPRRGEVLPRSSACRQQDLRTAGQQSSRPATLRPRGATCCPEVVSSCRRSAASTAPPQPVPCSRAILSSPRTAFPRSGRTWPFASAWGRRILDTAGPLRLWSRAAPA